MLKFDVRLEWFESFLAVIDNGSFVAAAEAIHRSQPRVSMHIASLEREARLSLFDRRKRPVELTEAGAALAEHARTILQAVGTAEVEMAAWHGPTQGAVTLGSYPSASAAFVPTLLEHHARLLPQVKLVLIEHSTLDLDTALSRGEADLCLRPISPTPDISTLRCIPLWREPLVVVHRPDHPLAEIAEPLPISEVAAHAVITIGRPNSPDSPEFEPYRAFREYGYNLEPVHATNQPQTLVALVRQGLGVGLTNALATHMSDTGDLMIRKLEGRYDRRVGVFWNSAHPLTPAAAGLLNEILAAQIPDGTRPVDRRETDSPGASVAPAM